MQCTKSVVKY